MPSVKVRVTGWVAEARQRRPLLDRAFDELSGFECEFDVESFPLYIHDERVGWQPTRSFVLQAPADH